MRRVTEYVKMRVLAAIDLAEGKTIRDRIRAVSEQTFLDEEGNKHRFTWRTIETWRVRYNKHGFTACQPKPRSDKGRYRKMDPEVVQEAVEQARAYLRKEFSISELYRVCIEKCLLRRERIAPNTFRRMIQKYEMLKPDEQVSSKHRLAFSKRYANEMWQVDTLHGPFASNPNGKKVQTKLIAFMDDASRLLCHGQFFFTEDIFALKTTLRNALYKRGVPQSIYADNGAIYKSHNFTMACARLGTLLRHTPVRDGASKGKIERFFRTVRDNFLSRELDLGSLTQLNKSFILWAEEHYNNRTHSTLGVKPVDRFALDRNRIQYLPNLSSTEELFFSEETRNLSPDNCFRFKGKRYECPVRLRATKIQVRYDPDLKQPPPVVFHKGQRIGEAFPVDFIANDRAPIDQEKKGGQK